MIYFLSHLFIKNPDDVHNPKVRQAYGCLCGIVGVCLNVLLFIGKWIAGLLSGSIAITADAVNNLSDAGSSLITLVCFRLSGQKPDAEHPYGHGRIEYISGLFVSIAIILMGFELARDSVTKILHPDDIQSSALIIVILLVSIGVKLYMFLYNRLYARKIDSAAMKATANDSLSDTLSTAIVLLSILISRITGWQLDGWMGMLVSVFILYTGVTTLKETISPLLGQPPKKEFVEEIEHIVLSAPDIIGIHDLLVHDYGPGRCMISFHAEVCAHEDLLKIHDEIDNIERTLEERLHCSATIHMDPIVTDDPETRRMNAAVLAIAKSIMPQLSIHDFRMVQGPTHTNLIFDVLVPYGAPYSDDEFISMFKEKVSEIPGARYFAVVNIDHIYC